MNKIKSYRNTYEIGESPIVGVENICRSITILVDGAKGSQADLDELLLAVLLHDQLQEDMNCAIQDQLTHLVIGSLCQRTYEEIEISCILAPRADLRQCDTLKVIEIFVKKIMNFWKALNVFQGKWNWTVF